MLRPAVRTRDQPHGGGPCDTTGTRPEGRAQAADTIREIHCANS